MKRVTAMMMCLVMMLTSLVIWPAPSQAAYDDYTVSANYFMPDVIRKGTTFEIEVSVTNNTNSSKSPALVVGNQTSFGIVTGFSHLGSLTAGETKVTKAKLKAIDGSKILEVKIGADSYYIDVDVLDVGESTAGRKPVLTFSGKTKFPTGNSGDTVTFDLPVKNTSKYAAYSVVMSPVITDAQTFPFELDDINLSQSVKMVGANQTITVPISAKIRKDAQTKTYPVKMRISYTNGYGDGYTEEDTFYVNVKSDYVPPQVEIYKTEYLGTNMQQQKDLVAGQENIIRVYVRNNGNATSKNVAMKLEGFKSDGITILDPNNQRIIPVLASKGQTILTFTVKPNKALKSGYYPLTYTSEYKDEYGNAQKVSNELFFSVRGTTGMVSDVSIVKMTAPSTAPGVGKDFQVVATIKNHSAYTVENLKVMLEMDPALVPRSISIVNVPKLEPGETKDVKFTVFAGPGAESKNYPITVKLSTEGSEAITGGYVGVFVNGASASTPRVMITGYEFGGEVVNAGENFDIKVTFQNTNKKAKIQNLKITLSPDGDLLPMKSSSGFFVDELGAKASFTKKLTLKTKSGLEGENASTIFKIEYEDATGKAMPVVEEKISIPIVQKMRFEVGEPKLPMEVYVGEPARVTIDFYNMGKSKVNNLMVKSEGDFDARNKSYYYGNIDSGKTDYYDLNLTAFKEGDLDVKVTFTYENSIGQQNTVEKVFKLKVLPPPVIEEPMDPGMLPEEEPQGPNKWIFVGIGAAVIVVGVVLWKKRKAKKLREEELEFDE